MLLAGTCLTACAGAPAQDRAAGWRTDLELALTEFLPADRAFTNAARESFERNVRSLQDSIEELSDQQIVARLARATAESGNAHTRAYVLRNRSFWRRFPIRVWWFDDGLFVVRTRPGQEDLIGWKVTAIAGRPVAEIEAAVAPLYAGNGSWRKYMTTYTLTSPDALIGVGVIDEPGAVTMTLERDGASRDVLIEPLPLDRFDAPTEAWWDLTPSYRDRTGPWVSGLPADSARLPLYLRNPSRYYWFAVLPDRKALYFQYNRANDMPQGESFDAFGARLLGTLRTLHPATVIVDLRFNTGGNIGIGWEVFQGLRSYAEELTPGGLTVITGHATFSAGVFHALQLSGAPAVSYMGDWPGDGMSFWSEGGNLKLPFSGLTLHYADGYHSYSPDPVVAPDSLVHFDGAVGGFAPWISVPTDSRAYFAGTDPVVARALDRRAWRGGDPLVRVER